MITVGYVTTLNAYDAWATTRVFETAARLDPSALDAASLVGLGSLRALLVHTVSAAWIWRSRLEGVSPSAQLDPADFPTLAAIRKRWESEAAAMTAFLTQLDDAILAQPVAYRTTTGVAQTTARWKILVHLANHSTQHRSEAGALLTVLGHSPGDLDMIAFFRSTPQGELSVAHS
jgi:uncharacterized damage-inducible protein DinB